MTGVDVGALVRELAAQSRRLGLTWGLRPATVTGTVGSPTTATYDGDDVEIRVTSLVGSLYVGQRVMVMFVPPAGNFVIGSLSVQQRGTIIARADRSSSTSTTTTELAAVSLSKIPVIAGVGYQVMCSNLIMDSSVNNDVVFALLRHTTDGSTAGLGSVVFGGVKGVAGAPSAQFVAPIVRNYYPDTSHTLSLCLTVGRDSGTGNVSLVVANGFPIEITVTCTGAAPADSGVDI